MSENYNEIYIYKKIVYKYWKKKIIPITKYSSLSIIYYYNPTPNSNGLSIDENQLLIMVSYLQEKGFNTNIHYSESFFPIKITINDDNNPSMNLKINQ